MTTFTMMWGDIEDPKAGPDKAANAAFIQAGLDQCAWRIRSGVYGNEGSLQRIVGDYQFTGFPYFRASGDGDPDVNNVPSNGMNVAYEQWTLDRNWNGHVVDIIAHNVTWGGGIEFGVDVSNYTGVPDAQWFIDLWNDAVFPIRFVIFGDQMPYVTRAQVAAMEASGLPFEAQLYTYFNMPGGDYYSGRDGAQQMRDALDQMGVPEPAAPDAPPEADPVSTPATELDATIAHATEARRLLG